MASMILKIGGSLLGETGFLKELAHSLNNLCEWDIAILHGGGPMISRLFRVFGKENTFINGLRATNDETIDLVEMALSGQVNKFLARKLTAFEVPAVGISGTDAGLFLAAPISSNAPAVNRVGEITTVQLDVIFSLWVNMLLPVVSPVAVDSAGNALNVNADSAAYSLAARLKADTLIFLSDVPGIRLNETVVPVLTPEILKNGIASGEIHSGMIPKLEKGFQTLDSGVKTILISTWQGSGTLENLLTQKEVTFTQLKKGIHDAALD
ncbi:acetylglutamate kinase [bacterium BMS3Abin05]|nr:acetylglutamate kinase [bacterium BMS3Abin05]GBE27138.1 acetylglutamate kinase [bacterium BMS3Bbin03]